VRDVHLIGLPVVLFLRTREHHDELVREFTLMAIRESVTELAKPGARTVLPARLRELIDILGRRFEASTSRADIDFQVAVERGDTTVDLTYQVRADLAAELVTEVTSRTALMDDADEFCRQERLLTLPRDAGMVAFTTWYNREFLRQLDGLPPTPWDGPLS
jgi:hypothetical protein